MKTAGLIAEFATPEQLVAAIHRMRGHGYRDLDAFTPFPIREAERALGLRRSPIGRIVAACAFPGAGLGYFIQWYANAYDYPLDVGGRPAHAIPAFVPITFESGILVGGISAILSALLLAGLPRLVHPLFDVAGFERASIDRFWIGVDARDAAFNRVTTKEQLEELSPISVAWVGAPPS